MISQTKKPSTGAQADLKHLELLAKLMDTQFRIPGTNFRFGLDAIIGLVPGIGDLTTFGVSAFMLLILAQKGASGFLLARMVLNVLIDTIIGSIPFLGDLFDLSFKANSRNLRLMQEHYKEGRHKGSAGKVIIPLFIALLVILAGIVWLLYKMIAGLIHLF